MPVLARRALLKERIGNSGFQSISTEAAVLLVDITGYTALVQRAMCAGADRVERFNRALNDFFCRLINSIYGEGGDVVAFAGDALFAAFPVEEGTAHSVVANAAQCALGAAGLQLDVASLELAQESSVRSHITLAFGSISISTFSRPNRRRHFFVAGNALERLAGIRGRLSPGKVIVDISASPLLGPFATLLPLDGGVPNSACVLTDLRKSPNATRLLTAPHVPQIKLFPFLPGAIAERVVNKKSRWLAEMRFVCPIFASLSSRDGSNLEFAEIVEAILTIEDTLVHFGGELLQVRTDDHGVTAIGMFGSPGCTHEDDAVRAARAACVLRDAVDSAKLQVSVGVSSGAALCGTYGNAQRQDYVIVGDVMNLAARMMQRKEGVLSDQALAHLAGRSVAWSDGGVAVLKGFSEPTKLVQLSGAEEPICVDNDADPANPPRLIGRTRELAQIDARLRAHLVQNKGSQVAGPLLIEGEAGMGKSALARFALHRSRQIGLSAVVVGANRIERFAPYRVWRAALQALLTPREPNVAVARVTEIVLKLLADEPELQPFIPLLCDVLPLEIVSTELTRQMEPSARAAMTTRLLLHLLKQGTDGPTLIVFEDAHWIDSASWMVIDSTARQAPHVLLLLTSRPESAAFLGYAMEFLERYRSEGLHLEGLSDSEIAAIVSARLGADHVAPDVGRFIRERSAGNPFFAEELALVLRERGQLRLESRSYVTAAALNQHTLFELPNTVRATILERIDRLNIRQQLLIKIASVIGVAAPMHAVTAIYADHEDLDDLRTEVEAIQLRSLADVQERGGETLLCFRHAITQEAAYSMLTPSQRRSLHHSAALWYERSGAQDAGLLAHHFRAAEEKSKAFYYLNKAGEQALSAHANLEAVQFLDATLALEDELSAAPKEGARRRRLLAEAYLKLSQLGNCRKHLVDALSLAGHALPAGKTGLALDLIRVIVRSHLPGACATDVSALTAQLHQLRAEVAYFEHDTLSLLHGTFAGLQESLKGGASRELASAHGTAAIVFGLLRLQRLSGRHIRAAIQAAIEVENATTGAYVQHLASVCASAIGDWDNAKRTVALAGEGYRRVGDEYRWQSTRMILAYQALHRGEFDGIDAFLTEADESSIFPGGPLQLRTWFRTVQLARANAAAARGAMLPPLGLVREVQELGAIVDPSQALLCRGFVADAMLLHSDMAEAERQASMGLRLLQQHWPTTYFSLFGIVSIGNGFISLATRGVGKPDELSTSNRIALQALRRFAMMVPIARPCVFLNDGRIRLLAGDTRRGRKRLHEAVQCARSRQMKGVEAAAKRALDGDAGQLLQSGGGLAWA